MEVLNNVVFQDRRKKLVSQNINLSFLFPNKHSEEKFASLCFSGVDFTIEIYASLMKLLNIRRATKQTKSEERKKEKDIG